MDFEETLEAIRKLLVDARKAAEELLTEADYEKWKKAIEARAKRDWLGQFDALVRPLLKSDSGETFPPARRAAKDARRSLRRLTTFVPAVRANNHSDPVQRLEGTACPSPTSGPKLDGIRMDLRGAFDRLKETAKEARSGATTGQKQPEQANGEVHLTPAKKAILTALRTAGETGMSYDEIDEAVSTMEEEVQPGTVRNFVPKLRKAGLVFSGGGGRGSRTQRHFITSQGRIALLPSGRFDDV